MKSHTMAACLVAIPVAATCLFPPKHSAAAVQKVFYVSPSGADENPGTEEKPLKTIEAARDAVRAIHGEMTGDIEVVLRGGTYRLNHTLAFDHRDSGTGDHNVIYRNHPGETPLVSGGKPVTGWQPDAGGRWKARCDDHFRQLYVTGKRAVRARSTERKLQEPGEWFQLGIAGMPGIELFGEDGYRTSDVAMAAWGNPQDLEFCYHVGWCHTRCKVDSIADDQSHAVIRMVQPQFMWARRKEGLRAHLPNYMENALELLDQPGEWYLDRSKKTLYYQPRPGEQMDKVEVIAPVLEKLVELRGLLDKPVERLQFHGITFAHATWLLPNRIGLPDVQANFHHHKLNLMERSGQINNVHNEVLKMPANIVCRTAKHVRFQRCTFTQLGGAGVDLEYGSQDNMIVGCHFRDISGTAVQVGDVQLSDHHPADTRTMVRNNQVLNNLIEDCAVEYMGGVGIFVGYTDGTRIAHNEIRNLPYSGISVGWGWGEEDAGGGNAHYYQPFRYETPTASRNNRVEHNHIHHILMKQSDGGGIYTLGNQPGTVIENNHLHDAQGVPGGIYLDEGSGFIEVTGNVAYNVSTPMNYNNRTQNRIDTCNEHDNWFGNQYAKDAAQLPHEVRKVIDNAGLEPEFQDLLQVLR